VINNFNFYNQQNIRRLKVIKKILVEKIDNPERFKKQPLLSRDEVRIAIEKAITQIEKNMVKFGDSYPTPSTFDNKYKVIDNIEWTNGFWTGMLWIAYEFTKDDKFKKLAENNVQSYKHRIDNKIEVDHHDMGFLYSLSCVAAYKVSGNNLGREAALEAAEYLTKRYQEKGKFIQAWGQLGAKDNYRLIIDCLLNIPLLYWASEQTGNIRYYDIAFNHYITACNNVIRDDA